MGEASYIMATGNRRQQKQLSQLVKSIAQTLKASFGSFLIVEVWIGGREPVEEDFPPYKPLFRIIRPKNSAISTTIEMLEKTLKDIKIRTEPAKVDIVDSGKISPPGLPPLITTTEAKQLGYHIIGIEVRPIYQNDATNQVFPLIRRDLHRGISRALKNSFFEFTHVNTLFRPIHFQSLGRFSMVKAVWEVDRQLAEICNGFDFLLQVTPANSHAAWTAFQRSHYDSQPEFVYRPLPMDPALAKRRLFSVPIERIEDPTLAQLFREQQLELDRKFTMLIDRGTPRFMYGSLQFYGAVEESLGKQANELLEELPSRSRDESHGNFIDAKALPRGPRRKWLIFGKHYQKAVAKFLCGMILPA